MSGQDLIATGVLASLAGPGLRAASSSAYRRVFPLDSLRLGAISGVYLALVLAMAFYDPRSLHLPAAIAAAVLAYLLWRSRPGFGVASGLPLGSLQPLPVAPWSDPEFYAKQASRHGEIFKMSQFGRPMVCLVGLERANRLLLEHDERLVAPPLPFSRFIEGGYLRYLPEETHARYRRAFRSVFHSEAMTHAEPRLAEVFRRGLAAMVEESRAAGSVPVKPRLMRVMFAAWAELFYGIEAHHADFVRLKDLFHVIDARKARWARRGRVEAALAEIEAILRRRANALRESEKGAPGSFLAVLAQSDPDAISDRTILGNLVYIMQITWGDVTGLLLWVFKKLSDHPAWQQRLRDAVARSEREGRDLATRIVLETLRLEQSESRYRRATADLELDGFRIPKDWLIRMCIRESHRDEHVFPNPRTFDPDRFSGRTLTRGEYAPFGAFRLACIGEDVAKTVVARFAAELVSGFEWEVADDGPAEINSWVHNAPSPRFRVRMSARPRAV